MNNVYTTLLMYRNLTLTYNRFSQSGLHIMHDEHNTRVFIQYSKIHFFQEEEIANSIEINCEIQYEREIIDYKWLEIWKNQFELYEYTELYNFFFFNFITSSDNYLTIVIGIRRMYQLDG